MASQPTMIATTIAETDTVTSSQAPPASSIAATTVGLSSKPFMSSQIAGMAKAAPSAALTTANVHVAGNTPSSWPASTRFVARTIVCQTAQKVMRRRLRDMGPGSKYLSHRSQAPRGNR